MAEEETAQPPKFDVVKLAAQIRGSTDETQANALIDEAYRRVFAGDLGRLVLAHHLMICGVGSPFGADISDAELRYRIGRHDSAIELANMARQDAADLAVAVLSNELKEPEDERRNSWVPPADDEF